MNGRKCFWTISNGCEPLTRKAGGAANGKTKENSRVSGLRQDDMSSIIRITGANPPPSIGLGRMTTQPAYESIPLRMHPRVFAALGADLVSNDVVAVIELVKNSYDAFAHRVRVRFRRDAAGAPYIEIEDDGLGMTKDVIQNVWSVVATPYKESDLVAKKGGRTRRVVGNRGLGRLSGARLGDRLEMLTQAPDSPCWEVTADWPGISQVDDISQSSVYCREHLGASPFVKSGTLIRILDLKEAWDENRIDELRQDLRRFISPFDRSEQFSISLSGFGDEREVEVEAEPFLSEPKYSVKGEVDAIGNIAGIYKFSPIGIHGDSRTVNINHSWEQLYEDRRNPWRFQVSHSREAANCGPFAFEIRAWDIGAEGTGEISEKYQIRRSMVRKAIREHKGISIYRDGILVLPKTDRGHDWLGLDLRRVGRVGPRLSTSQIVGYISISADKNPKIEDTSDRERLSTCPEVEEFQELIMYIVGALEGNRDQDRRVPVHEEKPMDDLLSTLSAQKLVEDATQLAQSGESAKSVVPLIRNFDQSLSRNREAIKGRFVYYSRLATIGTIAQMLIHEIRNRTTTLGGMLGFVRNEFGHLFNRRAEERFARSDAAIRALERLADTFSPLASRNFRRGRRHSMLEDRIRICLEMRQGEIQGNRIQCAVPKSETRVAIDPGELDAIILNLITNSLYWLSNNRSGARELKFDVDTTADRERVEVWVHDNGPGLDEDNPEIVFLPGITRKPGGIGMGLTVASELVSAHGGQMKVDPVGKLDGASFGFDLPRAQNTER